MKLRCTHNSIRMRIRKSELDVLHRNNKLSEKIHFPSGEALEFSIIIDSKYTAIGINKSRDKIGLLIPKPIFQNWANNNEVGIYVHLATPSGIALDLILEKDFPCKTREEENKADYFSELENNQENC